MRLGPGLSWVSLGAGLFPGPSFTVPAVSEKLTSAVAIASTEAPSRPNTSKMRAREPLKASRAGTVQEIKVKEGKAVDMGALLLVIG